MRLIWCALLLAVAAPAACAERSGAADVGGGIESQEEEGEEQKRRLLSAASDLAALNACFKAWGSPSSVLTGGWGGAGPVCSGQNLSLWTGVTCAGDIVVALDVSRKSLSGSISEAIAGLTGLTALRLSSNSLSGSIPSSIGGLTGLTLISLDDNYLTLSIPSSFGCLTRLTCLCLNNNMLSDSIPSSLGALTRLTSFNLNNNALSSSIPSSLGLLTGLTFLGLRSNSLSATLPSALGFLTALTWLDINTNRLSGSVPSSLGALTALTRIDLSRNKLTSSIPATVIGNLTNLNYLNFGMNSLSGSLPSALCGLTGLTYLNFNVNKLSGNFPSFIAALSPTLAYLDMNSNRLSDSIPSSIGGLTALSVLSLYANDLSGSIPSSVGALTALTILRLDVNSLIGSIPSTIGGLTNLVDLDLNRNALTGTIPSTLGNLARMTFCYLGSNLLSSSVPSCFGSLTALKYLELYRNALSGPVPSFLRRLTRLTTLDLGDNSFAGSIPSELGLLTALTQLSLNQNSLSGLVPSALGDMSSLTDLDLFINEFSGSLPSSFCRLNNNIKLHIEGTNITSYPACMSAFHSFTHPRISKPYTAAPSPFPSSAPTMYPTSSTTLVPAQWRFASFQVSQSFVCVGAAALCSSAALFKPVVQAANTRLWARYADRETQWLTERTIDASAALSFNDVSSVAGGILVSYFYTFRPIDLKMSSMEAVRLSFQRAVASLNLTAYNAELMQVLQSISNPLSALTAPLQCTKIDVGPATLANGVPTAFPTTTPVAVFVLSAQIALVAAGTVAVALSFYVWFLRSELQQQQQHQHQHQHQQGEAENSERIVAFRPNEFALPIVITVMAAASNVYQIKTYFQDPSTAALAAVMMASRVAVALYSGTLLYLALKRKSYNRHLAATLLHKATLWVAVAALALLDPTHLRFFPWRASEFAERSRGFPTLRFFKLALGCTACNALLQLSVSAARGLSFSSVASLVLSLLLFCSTVFTIVVKLAAEKIHEHDLTLLLAERGDVESMGTEIATLRAELAAVKADNAALRGESGRGSGSSSANSGIALVPLPLPLSLSKRPTVNFDDVYNPASAAEASSGGGIAALHSGRASDKLRDFIPAKASESRLALVGLGGGIESK